MTRRTGLALALTGAMALLGCGGSSKNNNGGGTTGTSGSTGGTGGSAGFTITISNLSFSPLNLAVPPGATVTVVNQDGVEHTVTSEAAPGAFTPGSVGGVQFDTGRFTGQMTFTIPANAQTGAVVPYYCGVHTSGMRTPTGTITIDPNAQGSTTGTTGTTGTTTPTPMPMPGGGGGGY